MDRPAERSRAGDPGVDAHRHLVNRAIAGSWHRPLRLAQHPPALGLAYAPRGWFSVGLGRRLR